MKRMALYAAVSCLALFLVHSGELFGQESADWARVKSIIESGNYGEARKELARFISDNPESNHSLEARFYLAYLETDMEKRKRALREFVRDFPKSDLAPKALGELAKQYQAEGNQRAARDTWKAVLRNYPGNPVGAEALYWLGIFDMRTRNFQAARAKFQRIVRDFPRQEKSIWGQMAIGDSYCLEGEYNSAITAFIQCLALFPNSDLSSDLHYRLGRTYELTGDVKRAREEYRLVIKNYPSSMNAPAARARLRQLKTAGRQGDAGRKGKAAGPDSTLTISYSDSTGATVTGGRYGLQLGAFSRYTNALSLADELRAKGYQVSIRMVNRDGRKWHLVVLGSYSTYEEAKTAGEEFSAKEKLPYFIIPL